jgi:hypothetical protein
MGCTKQSAKLTKIAGRDYEESPTIDQTGWPGCGEIDVMENFGKDPTVVHGTVHGPGDAGAAGITASCPRSLGLPTVRRPSAWCCIGLVGQHRPVGRVSP